MNHVTASRTSPAPTTTRKLTWLTRTVEFWGNIASIGLAGSHKLETTVMPFILRGVTLAGIDSVMAPLSKRQRAWDRLARDLEPALLERMIEEVPLEGAVAKAQQLMAGQVRGRVVVRVAA